MSKKPGPVSEEDWITHAINIHGVFFERWCEHVIVNSSAWKVESKYEPVEFPPGSGKESNLDLRAYLKYGETGNFIELLIECKKNNPEFIKWIFFPKRQVNSWDRGPRTDLTAVHQITVRDLFREPEDPRPGVNSQILQKMIIQDLVIADEAREVRGSYSSYRDQSKDKTKTANNSITDAARQIALATQAIFTRSSFQAIRLLRNKGEFHWVRRVFLPVIVTSARLYTCNFNPGDVDSGTGEIDFDKVTIEEEKFLLYEYPIPPHLQQDPSIEEAAKSTDPRFYSRMDIFVVHSGHFAEFLQKLARLSHMILVG